ncbi:MAG: amidohydrolase family protein [Bryobacteraceae bacterium]
MSRLLLLILLAGCAAALSAASLAIRNATVVDIHTGVLRPHSTVVIRNDRITAVGPVSKIGVPKGAKVVNGAGKYLIPGLWDMQVHLWDKQNMFPLYVANGVTSIRDMGSDYARTSAWRKQADAGKIIGPRVFTSGPPSGGPGSPNGKLPVVQVTSPEQARRTVTKLYDNGADFVAVLPHISYDAYIATAHRARILRIPLAGPLPESVTIARAIGARHRSIEKMSGLLLACSSEQYRLRAQMANALAKHDSEDLEKIRQRTCETFSPGIAAEVCRRMALYGVWQVPALTHLRRNAMIDLDQPAADPHLKYVPESIRAEWPEPDSALSGTSEESPAVSRSVFEKNLELFKIMRRFGVGMLAGSVTGEPYVVPGFALHDELALLVESGLSPLQALQSATTNAARFFGYHDVAGAIAKGYVADLILLDANPLKDIGNTQKISAVVLRGRLFGRKELDGMLVRAAAVK